MQNQSLMILLVPSTGHTWLKIADCTVNPLVSSYLCTFGRNDLPSSTNHKFFQKLGTVIGVLRGPTHKICRLRLLLFSSRVGLGFSLSLGFWCFFWCTLLIWFRAVGAEGDVSAICWAWRSVSSLFAACSSNCCNVYLFTIASWRSSLITHGLQNFASDDVIRIRKTTLCYLKP